MTFRIARCAAIVGACVSYVRADQVLLKNGDKISGTIESAEGGKLKIKTDYAGELTIDMANVQTFSSDHPLEIDLKTGQKLNEPVAAGEAGKVVPATSQPVAIEDVKWINHGKPKWTGSITANGIVARGNTHTETFGIGADATYRRDDEVHNDRLNFAGQYLFSKQNDRTTGSDSTTADRWFLLGKYDKFFTEKWYGYALMRYDHDRIADLDYRLSPGVGVGYQWVERPDFKFSTEAGVSYVYEQYSNDGNSDRVALRLAYHVEKKLNDKVSVIHNLEWLPAFDDPSDYNLNADLALRAQMTKSFFTEFKIQYQRDSTPAPGALKDDVQLLFGVGWTF